MNEKQSELIVKTIKSAIEEINNCLTEIEEGLKKESIPRAIILTALTNVILKRAKQQCPADYLDRLILSIESQDLLNTLTEVFSDRASKKSYSSTSQEELLKDLLNSRSKK